MEGSNKGGLASGGLAEKIHLGLAPVRPMELKLWAKQKGQLFSAKASRVQCALAFSHATVWALLQQMRKL